MIENRRYLIWSGAYFLAVVALCYSALYLEFPDTMEVIQDSQLYVVIALPAALFAGFTTLSAMRHMIVHKNYGWLVSTVFLVFVSAYLYGLLVATKQKKDTV